jgi:pyrroline-5-carboxylate reductase
VNSTTILGSIGAGNMAEALIKGLPYEDPDQIHAASDLQAETSLFKSLW